MDGLLRANATLHRVCTPNSLLRSPMVKVLHAMLPQAWCSAPSPRSSACHMPLILCRLGARSGSSVVQVKIERLNSEVNFFHLHLSDRGMRLIATVYKQCLHSDQYRVTVICSRYCRGCSTSNIYCCIFYPSPLRAIFPERIQYLGAPCNRTTSKMRGFVSQDHIGGFSTKRECANTHK
jgi:hypothetical protein